MKKTVFALSLIVTMAATSASASVNPDPSGEEAKANFKKEFPGAELISWINTGTMLKAIFIYDGYRSEAYFNEDGELQGSARNIFYNQLPLAVTRSVDKRFVKPDVLEVCEITVGSGTSYILRLEDEGRQYKLQMDAGGNLIKKEKVK
jgi:hypothetical protein